MKTFNKNKRHEKMEKENKIEIHFHFSFYYFFRSKIHVGVFQCYLIANQANRKGIKATSGEPTREIQGFPCQSKEQFR